MTTTEDRIAWLEQKLRVTTGELVQANDRIEALEAALAQIHLTADWTIARAALAPEPCNHSWSEPFDNVVKCKKCGFVLGEQDK